MDTQRLVRITRTYLSGNTVLSRSSWLTGTAKTVTNIEIHCQYKRPFGSKNLRTDNMKYGHKAHFAVNTVQTHFGAWNTLNDGRTVSCRKAQQLSTSHDERRSLTELRAICAIAEEKGSQIANHVVSAHFAGTSHERSKQWYTNGWSQKVEIPNIETTVQYLPCTDVLSMHLRPNVFRGFAANFTAHMCS